MKTNNLLIIAAVLLFASCGGRGRPAASADGATPVPDMHTAETSLDYTGTYTGVLPAADCPGIEVRLTLGDDGRYTLDEQYIDRDTRFHTAGRYTVRENLLTLDGADGATYYRIEEHRQRMLTPERQPDTGELADRYVLTKTKTE